MSASVGGPVSIGSIANSTVFVDADRDGVSGDTGGYGGLVGSGLETPGDRSGACSAMVHRLVAESSMMKNCAPSAGVADARIARQIDRRVASMGQPHRWATVPPD